MYVHSCLQLVMIPMSTNTPSWKSVVLESSTKPGLSNQTDSPRLGLAEDSRNTDFRLGLLVLIKIGNQGGEDNYEQLHILRDWLHW